MAKLGGLGKLDFKTFFIKHGEKVVLSIVALCVVLVLGTTSWSRYDKKPKELVDIVEQSDQAIETATWPEEARKEFKAKEADDLLDRVQGKIADMEPNQYAWTDVSFYDPPFGEKKPIEEPNWLPVESLYVYSGQALLYFRKNITTEAVEETPEDPSGIGEGPVPSGISDDFLPGKSKSSSLGEEGYEEYEEAYEGYEDSEYMEEYGEEGGGSLIPSDAEGVAFRYIAVRGVFPRSKQIERLAEAMNLTYSQAEPLLKFYDFRLERQAAQQGADPWGGEWKEVDIQVANDVLTRAYNFDPDVVSSVVTDPVFTMPLPSRVFGVWRSQINHPLVENFELSPEEMEAQLELNARLIQNYRSELEEEARRNQSKGFASQQYDTSAIQRNYLGNNSDANSLRLFKEFEKELEAQGNDVRQLAAARIKERVSAAGRLLLFRYIDFDVQPGTSYRYRVKLVLNNPNANLPVEAVIHPSVVEGEYRETPWSEPSEVAYVEPDVKYFLTEADPGRGFTMDEASFYVYQWNSDSGTPMATNLKVQVGEYIGGETKYELIRPAAGTFEEEEVKFTSKDILLDVDPIEQFDTKFNSDLQFPDKSYGKIQVASLALMADENGKLVIKDPISETREIDKSKSTIDQLNEAFAGLKKAASDELLEGGEGYEEYYEEYGGYEEYGIQNPRKQRNASRRGSSRGRGGSSGRESSASQSYP